MDNINWANIEEASLGTIAEPEPGGYACVITNVEDDTAKKYLRIFIDFAEGEFKGDIRRCMNEQNFTPQHGSFVETYDPAKRKGIGLTKKFITRLEQTNRGFRWDNLNPKACIGKYIGVVLGQEEFWSKKHGEVRKRLYVYDICSGEELRRKAYTVPELRKYKGQPTSGSINVPPPPADWDNPPAPTYAAPQPYTGQQTQMQSYAATPPVYGSYGNAAPAPVNDFAELTDDDGDLPF